MHVQSPGIRTDLMLRSFAGLVADRVDCVAIRTPDNPTFRWGNYLVFDAPPGAGDLARWEDRFAAEIGTPPEIGHVAFTWDPVAGGAGDLAQFTDAGFSAYTVASLRATAVAPDDRLPATCGIRTFADTADWAAWVELGTIQNEALPPDEREGPGHRAFMEGMARQYAAMVDAGWGRWFGAWVDGVLVSSMGLFVRDGLGRFQMVDTHAAYRGHGYATTLLRHVMSVGFAELGATELVIVADVDDVAIGIYRRAGFVEHDRYVELELVDRGGGAE